MKLNSRQCIALIKIINKMQIKKDLLNFINSIIKLQMKNEKLQKCLLRIADEQDKKIDVVVAENMDLAEELDNTTYEIQDVTMEGIFTVVEAIPKAEKEVYKIVSEIKCMTEKEVEEAEGDLLFEFFFDVFKSETFRRFFMKVAQ